MPLLTLLNDHVLLEMPNEYHVDLGNALRTSQVLAVPDGSSGSPKPRDTAVFSSRDARSLAVDGTTYLFVRRRDLAAVIPATQVQTQSAASAPKKP